MEEDSVILRSPSRSTDQQGDKGGDDEAGHLSTQSKQVSKPRRSDAILNNVFLKAPCFPASLNNMVFRKVLRFQGPLRSIGRRRFLEQMFVQGLVRAMGREQGVGPSKPREQTTLLKQVQGWHRSWTASPPGPHARLPA